MSAPGRPAQPTRLKITDDKGFEKVVLIDKDVFPLGLEADEGLRLPEEAGASVARRHALIIRDGEGFVIVDKAGSCGTRVNGRPIRRAALKHGDQITLGTSSFRIQFLVEGSRASDLEERNLGLLLEVLKEIHSCLDVAEVSARAAAGVSLVLRPSWVALLRPASRDGLEVAAAVDRSGRLPAAPTRAARQVFASARGLFQPDQLCVPVQSRDGVLGVLQLGPREAADYTARDLELLEALASHTGLALANARRLEGLPGVAARVSAGAPTD
jgi:FHA domain-containing protein/GAF domain-containing protein